MIRFFKLSLVITGWTCSLFACMSLWKYTGFLLHALLNFVACFVTILTHAYVMKHWIDKTAGNKYFERSGIACGVLYWLFWPFMFLMTAYAYSFVCWSFGVCAAVSVVLTPLAVRSKKEMEIQKEKEREYWIRIRQENEQRRAEQERIAQEQARQEEKRRAEQERIAQEQARQEEKRRKREIALRRKKEEQDRRRRQESIRKMHSQTASDCTEADSQNSFGDSWEAFFSSK